MRNETKSCEICGKPIRGKPLRVKIEGSVFECVCNDCAKLGKVQKPPASARIKTVKKPQNANVNRNNSRGGMSSRVYTRDDGPMDDIVEAIEREDVAFMKSMPGIGAKTASQIILDLRGKLAKEDNSNYDKLDGVNEALKALGYKTNEIKPILKQLVKEDLSEDEYIKKALSLLMK